MKTELVSSLEEAKANIDRFERELAKSEALQAIMSYARSWHAYRAPDGTWRVAPSKFVGYAKNSAAAYLQSQHDRDGRRTERALAAWFDSIQPGTAANEDITETVLRLFAKYGRTPNKRLRVRALRTEGVPKREIRDGEPTDSNHFRTRITFDPGICGGRPCIRGMRIRVADILQMLSAGAAREEILADYPYLEDDDINATLEYAAAAADHRVVGAG